MTTTTVEKTKYEYSELSELGRFDSAGRWYPTDDIREYFHHLRKPSRAYPFSYMRSALTKKFYKWHQSRL